MAELKLMAQPRSETKKGPNRRLRAKGLAPGIVYGGTQEPRIVALDCKEVEHVLHEGGVHAIIDLSIEGAEGKGDKVMIQKLQRHPVHSHLIHVDLLRIRMDQIIHVAVPVGPSGVSEGVREGGVMDRPIREIEVASLPSDVPVRIVIDVSEMVINDAFRASQVDLGEKVKLISDPDAILFHVVPPKRIELEAEIEGEAEAEEGVEGEKGAEPELVGKKKEGEEAASE
jgi:large subunit ribosomal protein L25